MPLEMPRACECCGRAVEARGIAYICAFECAFCEGCTAVLANVCPNCGGELVRRPRRAAT